MTREDIRNLTDEELVDRYRNSFDTKYVGELFERYTHLVYGVCLKYLQNETAAEDATMQLFEKLITDLKKHHVTAFKPWLYTVVKNHCMMEFRKESGDKKRRTELTVFTNTVMENKVETHLEDVNDKEFILEHLADGIEQLKEQQKICIELFYLKDCSYAEIAKLEGMSVNEVKSHIQNGKRNLRNYINSKNESAQKGE